MKIFYKVIYALLFPFAVALALVHPVAMALWMGLTEYPWALEYTNNYRRLKDFYDREFWQGLVGLFKKEK